ncbi:DgyrCDS5532 [Dimorphilus gyrociliatus]|uniref:protein-tyrosine-phosphatase n=1 Tax=Dimorphilus gyrociliatus TaxID=2664684 RepID=A0A7I8VMG5_9ANNE|nr:DgyrCDS5532 [Dimorphilus gyrociliatus]
MLNKCRERNTQKCEEYWPKKRSQPKIFDDVDIQADLRSGEERIVRHFNYVAWPDFGVPESPEHFLRFLGKLRRCKAITQPETPPIVHCSAGVGRTGTLCLIDVCLEILENRKTEDPPLNVLQVLHNMRRYRPGLIQAYEQLAFSFTALSAAEKCQALDEEEEVVKTPVNIENDQEVDGNLTNSIRAKRQQRWIDTKRKIDEMKKNQENHNIKRRRRYVASLTIGGVVIAVAAIVFAVFSK